MKERFIERYKEAVKKFFNVYKDDSDSKMIKGYIVNEYEDILKEEFEMKHEEVQEIFDDLYWNLYVRKEVRK